MIRQFILFSTLAISVLFMFYNANPDIQWGFPFSNQKLSIETWLYFFFEHFILVLLSIVIFELEPKYKACVIAFLCIQIADTVDYCLTYGEPWGNLPLTWNHIKGIIFAIVMTTELWMQTKRPTCL